MRRRKLYVCVIVWFVLSACTGSRGAAQDAIGRWQAVQDSSIYEPSMFAKDVELRGDGQWVILLIDQDRAYTIDVNHYSFPANDRIEVTGWCWQGYKRFECAREYGYTLGGGVLRIFDDSGHNVLYFRAADIEPAPPPTLAPPFATPLPAR